MGWAKFDDQFTDHPKVVAAGPLAELLAMRAVIYCARYETDGFVQSQQLPRLALGITAPKKRVAELVQAGLWEEAVGGWRVHDFLDYHPSAEQKREEREQARERMAKVHKKKERSSEDVRPNDEGTSDYPDPTRTPPQDQDPLSAVADVEVSEAARELTRHLAVRLKANGFKVPDRGRKAHGDWLVAIDRLLRLDKADPDEAAKVADWATADSFWQGNIQSAPTFREKYPQLRLKWLASRGDERARSIGTGGVA